MPSGKRTVEMYEELADLEERRANAQMRDRFLILAADAAHKHGYGGDAERLRARLLEHNPHHLLRPYPTLAEALKSPDVASYVADLRRRYPPDQAGRLLEEATGQEEEAPDERPTTGPDGPPAEEAPAAPSPAEVDEGPPHYTYPEVPATFEIHDTEALPVHRPPAPARKPAAGPPADAGLPTLVEAPEVFPYPTAPPPSRPRQRHAPEADELPSALSWWVGTILFGLLLTAAAALLVYTAARPYLPL